MKEIIVRQLKNKNTQLILLFTGLMFLGYLAGYIFSYIRSPYGVSIKGFLENAFTITDAENYYKIAVNGYVTEGNDRLLLVFFPMFPLMIRALHCITFIDYDICQYIISFVSSCVSIVLLRKIALLDFSEEKTNNIALVYVMYPVMSFMITGLNEGVFMMFLFSTVYFVRKKKYILAGVFGYMVALTRLPGLCVGALMLVETIMYLIRAYKRKIFSIKIFAKQCTMMLMTLMGLGTYLLINYSLYGEFFKFFEFQRENWYQNVSDPINVIYNTIIKGQIMPGIYEIGISNLIACIVILVAIVYAAVKKVRISYIFYMLVYFWVCYSASWLLSGARYSIGAFVIFISLGIFLTAHKKLKKWFIPFNFVAFIYVSCLCTNSIIY